MRPCEGGVGFVLEGGTEIAAVGTVLSEHAVYAGGVFHVRLGELGMHLLNLADPSRGVNRLERNEHCHQGDISEDVELEYAFIDRPDTPAPVGEVLNLLRQAAGDYPDLLVRDILYTAIAEYDNKGVL